MLERILVMRPRAAYQFCYIGYDVWRHLDLLHRFLKSENALAVEHLANRDHFFRRCAPQDLLFLRQHLAGLEAYVDLSERKTFAVVDQCFGYGFAGVVHLVAAVEIAHRKLVAA